MSDAITLPYPTNSTAKGPHILAKEGNLELSYDFEREDGSIKWIEIKFFEALSYRFHQSVCSNFGSNIESNRIAEFNTSNWLSSVLDKWDQSVGWQKYQLGLGGRRRFRHYIMNFDDVGVLEVICSRVDVISPL